MLMLPRCEENRSWASSTSLMSAYRVIDQNPDMPLRPGVHMTGADARISRYRENGWPFVQDEGLAKSKSPRVGYTASKTGFSAPESMSMSSLMSRTSFSLLTQDGVLVESRFGAEAMMCRGALRKSGAEHRDKRAHSIVPVLAARA